MGVPCPAATPPITGCVLEELPQKILSRNSFLFSHNSPILCLFGWDSSFLKNLNSFHHFAKILGAHQFRLKAIH